MSQYVVGTVVHLTTTFTDRTGAAVDPGTVTLEVRAPGADVTSYTSVSTPAVVRDSAGVYHLDLDTSAMAPGALYYRWIGTGSNAGVGEGQCSLIASATETEVVPLPDYVITWNVAGTAFFVGDVAGLGWSVTRTDGGLVPVPSPRTITILRPDGQTDTISGGSVRLSSAVAAPQIDAGSAYSFTQAGIYTLTLLLTLDTGSGPVQTRQSVVLIRVS